MANTDNQNTQTKESQSSISPSEAITMLKAGNARFVAQNRHNRNSADQVIRTSTGQFPFATVVGCIDSRVPTEMVFDQGIGDIFSARIAGNFVNNDILGSLEFACKLAGSKAIIVLGHSSCGAVKGACDNAKLGNLTGMLENIMPAVDSITDEVEDRSSGNPSFVQKVSDANVHLTIEKIKKDSPVLKEMLDNGEIDIVGAMYHVDSGEVTFF